MPDKKPPVDVEKMKKDWDGLNVGPREHVPIKKLSPFKLRYGSHGFWQYFWANVRSNFHILIALGGIIRNHKKYMACREIRFELIMLDEKFGRLSWLACQCGKVFWMRAHGCTTRTLDGYRATGKFPDNRVIWRGNV